MFIYTNIALFEVSIGGANGSMTLASGAGA